MLSRLILENQIYFVTTKTFGNRRIFVDDETCGLLVETMRLCKTKYCFKLFGYAILPDHVHLLIEPGNRFDISKIVHRIKGNFAYQYLTAQNHKGSATRAGGGLATNEDHNISAARMKIILNRVADPLWVGEQKRRRIRQNPVWQKSFYDHAIRNEKDFLEKLNYIHKNPLKHNLTDDLDSYPWSSYQNYYLENNSLITINKLLL